MGDIDLLSLTKHFLIIECSGTFHSWQACGAG
jgi:hypothetical protein